MARSIGVLKKVEEDVGLDVPDVNYDIKYI